MLFQLMHREDLAMPDWYPKRRLGDLPKEAASRWPDAPALVDQDRWWTYAELDAEVDRVAKGLMALGVTAEEKVALWIVNRAEFVFAFFAIAKIGAVAVPLNTRYRGQDFAQALRQADCALLIAVGRSGPIDYAAIIRDAIPGIRSLAGGRIAAADFPRLERIVMIASEPVPGALTWEQLIASGKAVSDSHLEGRAGLVDPDGLAMIIFTSGTTGLPKGAMHSHVCIRSCEERAMIWGAGLGDAHLNYLPLFHLYAITVMLSSLLTGGRNILMDRFEAKAVLRAIEREQVAFIHGFDTHWQDLTETQAVVKARIDSLRVGTCASGPPSAIPVAYRAQSLCRTVSGFGMTECWSFCAMAFPTGSLEQRCETSGHPMPGIRFRIVDPETGRDLPADEPGEIWVSSYTNMLGYYADPEATSQTMQNGWLRSGDMGLLRKDGYLTFLGRYKDMLKVGGENVAPAEIESFFVGMAQIKDVAVVGVPDPRLHEVAAAFVVLRDRCSLSLSDMQAFARGKIASFKIPRHLFVVDQLPITPTGKVMKPDLRKRALAALADRERH